MRGKREKGKVSYEVLNKLFKLEVYHVIYVLHHVKGMSGRVELQNFEDC